MHGACSFFFRFCHVRHPFVFVPAFRPLPACRCGGHHSRHRARFRSGPRGCPAGEAGCPGASAGFAGPAGSAVGTDRPDPADRIAATAGCRRAAVRGRPWSGGAGCIGLALHRDHADDADHSGRRGHGERAGPPAWPEGADGGLWRGAAAARAARSAAAPAGGWHGRCHPAAGHDAGTVPAGHSQRPGAGAGTARQCDPAGRDGHRQHVACVPAAGTAGRSAHRPGGRPGGWSGRRRAATQDPGTGCGTGAQRRGHGTAGCPGCPGGLRDCHAGGGRPAGGAGEPGDRGGWLHHQLGRAGGGAAAAGGAGALRVLARVGRAGAPADAGCPGGRPAAAVRHAAG